MCSIMPPYVSHLSLLFCCSLGSSSFVRFAMVSCFEVVHLTLLLEQECPGLQFFKQVNPAALLCRHISCCYCTLFCNCRVFVVEICEYDLLMRNSLELELVTVLVNVTLDNWLKQSLRSLSWLKLTNPFEAQVALMTA